jgi:thiol:disulfide interchange protein/DsbC/DsbD-like thiol-disulfide interchange protein
VIKKDSTLGLFCLLLVSLTCQLTMAQASVPELNTRARLVADVESVVPGTTFTAGIVLTMAPGWHTYWENPGESGLATSITWTVPEGVVPGEISWPLPEKTIESGDVLTYGYSGETMLMVPITVSHSVAPGSTLHLKARVEWLECEKTCVPGAAVVELMLPVSGASPRPANQKLFATYQQRVPQRWTEEGGIPLDVGRSGDTLRITLTSDLRLRDLYPEPLEGYIVGRPRVAQTGGSIVVNIPLTISDSSRAATRFRGVLVFDAPQKVYGVSLEIPISRRHGRAGEGGLLDRKFETGQTESSRSSLFLYLFFAVVGGLILNIMPCVLPVIALKVFGLVRMAGDRPAQVKRLGWFFSLGILASFLLLALIVILLQIAGQQVGWGFQFQEPLFVIAMSAIVFAFGLSLFGVYEIRVPGTAISEVGILLSRQSGTGKGYAGSFWEGVFATVLATPCTAPFLGSALGFAFSQSWWTILLIFTAVAFGMALPYLILTMEPGWMKYLPKPGAWMETAKQFMGFLMMATLLWLLYVLGKQLGIEGVIWTCAFLLCLGVSCWLVGRFATLTATRTQSLITWAAAVLIAAGGYWLFLENVLDVRHALAGPPSSSGVAGEGGVQWQPFSVSTLEAKLQEGEPVFLDFTAEWCLTCKVNERTVLNDGEVVSKLRTEGLVAMKADWTNRNPEITRLLQKFGRSGVPLYVLFPAGRPSQPIVLPEVITPRIVIEAIDKAVAPR